MARQDIDQTGNDGISRTLAKIQAMFKEIYQSGAALAASSLTLGVGTKTATATGGAATLNQPSGVITTAALTTAAGAAYTLTLTNSKIAAADVVLFSVQNGTNTQGTVVQGRATPGAGSVVITVNNLHASEALNGTLKISFAVLKA